MKTNKMALALWVSVLLALAGLVVAYPAEQCAGYCKDSGKSHYDVGTTYRYGYRTKTVSNIGGVDERGAELEFTALVVINILTRCEYVLQVTQAKLNGSYRSDFSPAVEKNSLRFWNHNGVVKRLCPESNEPEWVLNIKRGILSTFQNSMEDLQEPTLKYETDILGTCRTHYEVLETTMEGTMVQKTKDLKKCSDSVVSHVENTSPLKKSVSLLRGFYVCVQNFMEDGVLGASVCNETRLFQPFSNGNSGAQTQISSNLEFISKQAYEAFTSNPISKTGSVFTTLKYCSMDESDEIPVHHNIFGLLQNLQKLAKDGLPSSYPFYYNQLVAELQQLSRADIIHLILDSDELPGTLDRNLLMNALSEVRTDEVLNAVRNMYGAGAMWRLDINPIVSKVPFMKSPSLQTIFHLMGLSKGRHFNNTNFMLTASSAVHAFCQRNSTCQQQEAVKEIMSWIEGPLGNSCAATSRKGQDDVIGALKSIGNAGIITNIKSLSACFENSDNPVKIRLAAIDALRRMDCDLVKSSQVSDIYSTLNENTEVRIAAYLMSMRCPSNQFFTIVKNTLHRENIKQVGAFVWTHLENLQNKVTPYQHSIRSIISKSHLRNKFNLDVVRFSRHYEGTTYFDSIGVGANFDSKIIFSPESYLPRSLNFNVTVDIFGESLNLFDVGTRLEGFETIIEKIFDKNGYFPDESIRNMLENLKSQSEKEIEALTNTFMSSRTLPKSPQGSIYARILGNELYLKQFEGLEELISSEGTFTVDSILKKALQSSIDVSKASKFLDLSHEVPTISGFPLKLKIDGTAALKFQSSPQSSFKDSGIFVKMFVNPSTVVTVNGEMTVDAFVAKSGLRSSSQMHTNTYLDFELDFVPGKVFDLRLNTPRQESDIFTVSSQVFAVSGENVTEMKGIVEDSEDWEYCTPSGLSKVVGFKLCSRLKYANASRFEDAPNFPLTGPFKFSTELKKTDNFSAYHFRYQSQKTALDQGTSQDQSAVILFETPGSSIERQFEMSYSLQSAETSLRFHAQAEYQNRSIAELQWRLNRSIVSELQSDSIALDWNVHLLENRLSGEGNWTYRGGINYDGDVTVIGLSKNPIRLAAGLALSPESYDLKFSAFSGKYVILRFDGNVDKSPSQLVSNLNLAYTLPGKTTKDIRAVYKWSNVTKSLSFQDKMKLSLKSSEFPEYNTKITWSLVRSQNYFDVNTAINVGGSEWHSRQLYRNWRTISGHVHFTTEASLSNPSKNLDYRLEIDHEMKAKQLSSKFLAQLNEKKKILILTSYEMKALFDGKLGFSVQSPWSSAALAASLKRESNRYFPEQIEIQLDVNGNCTLGDDTVHELEINGRYSRPNEHKIPGRLHVFDLTVKLPEAFAGGEKITLQCHLDSFKRPSYVTFFIDYKEYNFVFYFNGSRIAESLFIKATLSNSENRYTGFISGKNYGNESNLIVDLGLSNHILFMFHRIHSLDFQAIDSKLFWDYDRNKNKTVGVYIYHSEVEKIAKLFLEELFMGLNMRLKTETQENFVRRNFLFSSSWGESERNLSGELKLDGYVSDKKSHQFNEALGKNTIRQELTLSTSIATPVKNFELQWADLMHVREITEELFVADNPQFWVSTSSKVSLSWHEKSEQLLEGQNLDYLNSEDVGPEYFTQPNIVIERKLGIKADTTIANQLAAVQVSYCNDYSDVSAVELSFRSSFDENGLKSTFDSSYNHAVPLLHADLNINDTESRANLKFTSPIKALSSFSSTLITSKALDYLIFETRWEPDRNITFWYSVDWPVYVGAELMSPFESYKLVTFQYRTKSSEDVEEGGLKKETEITARFNDKEAFASFSGQKSDSGFAGSLEVSCPVLIDKFHVSAQHLYDDTKLIEKLSVKSGVLKQTVIDASFILDYQDYAHFFILTDFATKNSLANVEIVNKIEPGGLNCSFSGKWNKEYILLKLNGEYENEIDEALVQVQFSATGTPFKYDYDVTLQHSHDDHNYDSLLILPFETMLEHSLKIQNSMNWENSVVLKSSGKSSSIVNQQKYDLSHFENSMIADIFGQKSAFDISLQFSETDGAVEEGRLQLTTPWSKPINGKYTYGKSLKTVVLDSGEKSLLFTDHSFSLRYQSNKEIFVKANGHAATALYFVYDVAIQTPYFNNSHLMLKCDWTQPLKVAWVAFNDSKHAYEVHFDYLRQNLVMNSSLTFLQDSSQLSISQLNYDLQNDIKRIELFTRTKSKKYNVLLESLLKDNKCKAQIVLNSPFNNWKKFIISLDYDSSKNIKMAVVNYEKDMDSLSLSSTFMQTWSSIKGSVALNTKFQKKERIYSMTGECEYLSSDDLTAALTLFINDESSKLAAKWKNQNDEKTVKLEFNSPYKYRLINGSFSLRNNTPENSVFFDVNINNFSLASGLQINNHNCSSFLRLIGLPHNKNVMASFQLSKANSTLFIGNLVSDDHFVEIQGSHTETDQNSELVVKTQSSLENYEHSVFSANLKHPDRSSTQFELHAQFELSNNSCILDAKFNPSDNEAYSSGSFNVSFPELWNAVNTTGSFRISPLSATELSAQLYLQAGASVNEILFSSVKDHASLRSTLTIPILNLNSVNVSMARSAVDTGKSYSLSLNSTDDSLAEAFLELSLKLSESDVSFDCRSSVPEFQSIHLHSNVLLKDKFWRITFNRNENTMNATLKIDPDSMYDAIFNAVVRDEYLRNWDVGLMYAEKNLTFSIEKEGMTVAKLESEFDFSQSGFFVKLNSLVNNFSSIAVISLDYSEKKTQIHTEINLNRTKLHLSGYINANFSAGVINSTAELDVLPAPYKQLFLSLDFAPKGDVTAFRYTRQNQEAKMFRSGYFKFSSLYSTFSIEIPIPKKSANIFFLYDFRGANKTVALHMRNDTKFLELGGSLTTGPSLFELRLSHDSLIKLPKCNLFLAKYNVSQGVDIAFLCTNHSSDVFKLLVGADSLSKGNIKFNIPFARNILPSIDIKYDLIKHKKFFTASTIYKGSGHFINTAIDSANLEEFVVFNVSSQLLPMTKKFNLTVSLKITDPNFTTFNFFAVTDSLSSNLSVEKTSFNKKISLAVVSTKNRVISKIIGVELDFHGYNKTFDFTISRPSQNLVDQYMVQLYFKNFTADSKLIRKSNSSYDVVSLSYDFSNKRELSYSYRKNFRSVHELGLNLTDIRNSSAFLSNIWKIDNFSLNYNLSKVDSANFEMMYVSRNLNCQTSTHIFLGDWSVNASSAFFWNYTEPAGSVTPLNSYVDLKISHDLYFGAKDRLFKAIVSLNDSDYFKLLLSHSIDNLTATRMLDIINLLIYPSGEPGGVKSKLVLYEQFWGTDIKMDADLFLNELLSGSEALTNIFRLSISHKGEPKVSVVSIIDRSLSSNRYLSNIHYKSEYDHEFTVQLNSSMRESSQDIYSSFSWNDEVLFLNFTFDLNIDKSMINASVRSNHFQDMNVVLNYDIKSENKLAKLSTKFGSNTYIIKAQSTSSPTNKTLQLKFKSPIQGFSFLQLTAELSSFTDDKFLFREKVLTALVKEDFETKLDASFEVDSNPQNPKLAILVSGNNIPERNGKVRNWLITLHSERIPEVNVAIKISKWRLEEDLDAKKSIFIQLKGSPSNMQLSADFPDVSKSIKANYMLASNKTQKSVNFNFLLGKEKVFTMNGFLNYDKVGVTNFEVKGLCHPFGTFEYSGVYKNRGKQSIVLMLKHNEHVNEIEGHLRYTIRSSYFDLEFESALNSKKLMRVKGSYDFNDESVKSASLFIFFNELEVKANIGGRVTPQMISANMLVQSTVKIIENISLKFELATPNMKENAILLLAHVNDIDYTLISNVQIEKYSVSSKLDIVFPSFILKDLEYKVSFLENKFDMRMSLSDEELIRVRSEHEMSSPDVFDLSFYATQRIFSYANGPFSGHFVISRHSLGGLFYISKSFNEETTFNIASKEDASLFIQWEVGTCKQLTIDFKYGNEQNKLIFKHVAPEYNEDGNAEKTEEIFYFEADLPSLMQNVTKFNLRINAPSLISEKFYWQLDLEFESPLKFIPNLVNHLQLETSPKLKQLNFLLSLKNDVSSQENILQLDFASNSFNQMISLHIKEEFPNSVVPPLKVNGSCQYNLWTEIRILTGITIQNSSYSFEGDYTFDDELHVKAVAVTPSQKSDLKFGGFWNQTDHELHSKLYVNTADVIYDLFYDGDILNRSLTINAPKYDFEAKFSQVLTLFSHSFPEDHRKLTFNYLINKRPYPKYLGSINLDRYSFTSRFSSEEANPDWTRCAAQNVSCSVSKSKVGIFHCSYDKKSPQYLVEGDLTEIESFNDAPQKIKNLNRFLLNITNTDSEISIVSHVNCRKIQNKHVEVVGLKNWSRMKVNFFDEISLDFRKAENTGGLTLRMLNASHHLLWVNKWKDEFNLIINLESQSRSQPMKKLHGSLIVGNVGSTFEWLFTLNRGDLIVNISCNIDDYYNLSFNAHSSTPFGIYGLSINHELFQSKNIIVRWLLTKNLETHNFQLWHKKSFPFDSWCNISSPLIPIEGISFRLVSLTSEDMPIVFHVTILNQTKEQPNQLKEPDLCVKIGFKPQEGNAFLLFKDRLLTSLQLLEINGSILNKGDATQELLFSSTALINEADFGVIVTHSLTHNKFLFTLAFNASHQRFNCLRFSIDAPLAVTDKNFLEIYLHIEKDNTPLYVGKSNFALKNVQNEVHSYGTVQIHSPTCRLMTEFKIIRHEDFIHEFYFAYNRQETSFKLHYIKEIIDETARHFVSILRNDEKILKAKLGTSLVRNAFLFDSEVSLLSASRSFATKIEFLNKEEKKIALWLDCPQFGKKIGIDFSHRYVSLFNNSLVVYINTPFIRVLPAVFLNVSNSIDVLKRSLAVNYVAGYNNSTLQIEASGSSDMPMYNYGLIVALDKLLISVQVNKSMSGLSLFVSAPVKNFNSLFVNYSSTQQVFLISADSIQLLKLSYIINLPNFEPTTWYNQPFIIEVTALNPLQPVHFHLSQTLVASSYKSALSVKYHWDNSTNKLTGLGLTYSKTESSRKINLEVFEKQFEFQKDVSYDVFEYYAKVILSNQNELGFRVLKDKPKYSSQSLCQLTLYLPSKVVNFKAFKSIQDEFGVDKSSLGVSVALDDKEITAKFANSFTGDSMVSELVFSHFAYEHDIVLRTRYNPFIKRLQVIYSEDVSNMFTIELQTLNLEDEDGGEESSISFIVIHPASKFKFSSKLYSLESDMKEEAGILISYRNPNTDFLKTIQVLRAYNKTSSMMDFTVQSNQNVLKFGAGALSNGLSAKLQMNHREPLIFEMTALGRRERQIEVKYGESRTCRLYLGVPNNNKIVAKSSINLFESEEVDALFTLQLNNSRLLWGKLLLPSESFSVLTGIFEEYRDLPVIVEHIYLGFVELGQEDFISPLTWVPGKFADFLEMVVLKTAQELRQVSGSLEKIGHMGQKVIEGNHFYCKDILEGLKTCFIFLEKELAGLFKLLAEVTKSLNSAVQEFIHAVREGFIMSYSKISTVIEDIKSMGVSLKLVSKSIWNDAMRINFNARSFLESLIVSFRHQLVKFERTVIDHIQNLENTLERMLRKMEEYTFQRLIVLQTYYNYIDESLLQLESKVNDNLEALIEGLLEIKEIRYITTLMEEKYLWVSQSRPSDLIKKIKYCINLIVQMVVDDVKSNFGDYANSLQTSVAVSADYVEKYIDYPVFKNSFSFINRVYQKLVWLRKYHSISLKMQENVQKLVQTVKYWLNELKAAYDSSESSQEESKELGMVVNMDVNSIEFSQELPIDWDGFDTKPHFEQLQPLNQESALGEPSSFNTSRKYFLSDFYFRLLNILSDDAPASTLVSPFEVTGVLFGNENYKTFDGRLYNFSATKCSYLLAGDFEEKTIFVTVNYLFQDGDPIKKSVSVISQGHEIEINQLDRRVYHNGNVSELPIFTQSISVLLSKKDQIIVSTAYGFKVDCDFYSNLCSIKISGWKFGKTGGLLGTYDNEPANDFMLPNGTVVDTNSDFTASWALHKNQECFAQQSTSVPKIEEPLATMNDCEFYFRSKISPFRSCFLIVNPEPFLELCKFGLRHSSFCSVAAAYVASCNMKSILNLPAECVAQDSSSSSEEEHDVKSADIALVVEDRSCVIGSELKHIAEGLSDSFGQIYYRVNFAVVGFGGSTFSEPHMRTMDGKIWAKKPDLVNETLPSVRRFHSLSTSMNNDATGKALEYAMNLPWHSNTVKTVVLVLCHPLPSNYMDVLPALEEKEIQLQVITSAMQREQAITLPLYQQRGMQLSLDLALKPNESSSWYYRMMVGLNDPQQPFTSKKNNENRVKLISQKWEQQEKELKTFSFDNVTSDENTSLDSTNSLRYLPLVQVSVKNPSDKLKPISVTSAAESDKNSGEEHTPVSVTSAVESDDNPSEETSPATTRMPDSSFDSVEDSNKIADIAFVVEECMLIPDNLKNISSALSNVFLDDFDSVNFAVVRFGGDIDPFPRARTIHGELWAQILDLNKENLTRTGEYPADDMTREALKYTVKLPWHTGAVKMIILMLCHPLPRNYLDVLPELAKERISLQVIRTSAGQRNRQITEPLFDQGGYQLPIDEVLKFSAKQKRPYYFERYMIRAENNHENGVKRYSESYYIQRLSSKEFKKDKFNDESTSPEPSPVLRHTSPRIEKSDKNSSDELQPVSTTEDYDSAYDESMEYS